LTYRNRASRLLATLRHDGLMGVAGALAHGLRWRRRRLQQRVESALQQKRTRRLNETPTPGVEVADPKITVIVTSRDRSELLALALRSVQLQDFSEWECIVVDDASLDDSVGVAQSFAAVDGRFRVLAHDRVRGLSAARNTGIVAAQAPLVSFLDDDDLFLAGSLRHRFDALVEQPVDVVGSYCDWVGIDPGDRIEQCTLPRTPRVLYGIAFADLAAGAPFISSSPLLRRAAIEAAGGFDEDLARAEDVDMWMRLTRAGHRFVYARSVGIGYRRSPGSMVIGSPELQLECMLRTLRAADQPSEESRTDSTGADHRPLSAAGFELSYAPQILNYLALMATNDVERAVVVGCRELSEPFRRRLEAERHVATLTSRVTHRLGRRSPEQIAEVRDLITLLLERLASSVPPFHADGPCRLDDADVTRRAHKVDVPLVASTNLKRSFAGSVLLIAEAPYHVDELGPLYETLISRGVKSRFMAAAKEVSGTTWAIGRYADEILPFEPDLARRAAAIVVMNDWGHSRPAIDACVKAGVPTFAKIEGVQDFEDVDTARRRDPYRTAAVVLGQGQNDLEALPDRVVRIVGNTRLERIWRGSAATPGRHALINLNFTYSVLVAQRRVWVDSVEEALRQARFEAVVSRHPAERAAVSTLPTTSKPFRYEIARAGVLVSRFSTVPFEAMARGIPFVYHNPHAEQVPTFAEPSGAFLTTRSAEELAAALPMALTWQDGYRERAEKFFRRQIDVDDDRPAEVRAADVIMEILANGS
jgi:hypothetical protein